MKLNHLVLATTLVALAACTDYLDDFQDKYDNGNAFAEISSDSELSSSSKGNDIDSSDSKNSSSSVADQENLCKGGTVIYDYKVQGKLGFDLQFFRAGYSSTLPENERGIDFSSLTENDYAGFQWNGSYDVSSWKGICIEYTTDKDVSLYLGDSKKTEKVNLSANDNFKEIKWDDPAYKENISFNDFRKFFFDFSDEINMVISRITTIAKVDTSANSPTLDTASCTGSIIYDASEAPNYNVFGYGFVVYDPLSEKEASSNGITSNLSQNGSLFMPLAAIDKTIDIQSWDGFCVEYLSEGSITTGIVSPFVEKKASLIYKEMPNTNGEKSSFTWSWEENEKLVQEQKDEHADGFSIEKVESIYFTSHSSNSTITIHKITTLNSDVHFKCDGSEIFPKGRSIFNAFNIWSSTGLIDKITPSNNKYVIPLSGGNSVAPNNENAFKQELANAHGFCMEYSSDNYFMLSLNQYEKSNERTDNYAEREVGKGNQRVVFVLWDELKEQFTNFDFPKNHMLELSAPKNGVETTNITISRMTLLQ